MERPPRIKQLVTPEKSKEELYFDALKAKRDVLSSHYTMNQLRKSINRRIEEIPEDKLKEDPEVQQYELVKKEYDRRRELFLAFVGNLSEEDSKKISELTSLSKVDIELSKLKKPAEANPDRPTPRGFMQRVRDSHEKAKDAIMGANRISGDSETVESRMSPLGLRNELLKSTAPNESAEAMPAPTILPDSSEQPTEMEKVDRMIKYSIDTARPLELAYWESQKQAIKNKYYEANQSSIGLAEINKMFDFAKDTGRPLELSYWQTRMRMFEMESKPVPTPEPTQEVSKEKESLVIPPQQPEQPVELPIKPEEKTKDQEVIIEKPEEFTIEEPLPVELTREEQIEASDVAIGQNIVSLSQKETVDEMITHEDGPIEIPSNIELKKVEEADNLTVDNSVEKALEPLEPTKEIRERETFFKRVRKIVKNKAVIYISAGIMTLGAIKGEAYKDIPGMPSGVIKVLDKAHDIQFLNDVVGMKVSEATRYRAMPYLVAKYIGSNDYFGLEAVKATNNVGLESVANDMYEKSLDDYINNFSETRSANRFTTLDKHTVRHYIDTFTQIYTGQEQSESGIKTYQKLKDFVQKNFGVAKAYELALKVSSEDKISPELLTSAKDDLNKHGLVLSKAVKKSEIYFNQEEGIFNVVHDGKLIDTYTSRAGYMNVPKSGSKSFKSLGYGRTPDGTFSISSIEHGYSTLRWKDSFLPHGSEIRIGKTGEVEYKYNDGKWYAITGSEATYFDQGAKVQPNKSDGALKGFKDRSRGESPLTKSDFYSLQDGLMTRWEKNPFGPISYRLAGRAELIHSNPNDSDNVLNPSHGCIRLDKEDVKTLESYIGKGVSKIKISSEIGKTWSDRS